MYSVCLLSKYCRDVERYLRQGCRGVPLMRIWELYGTKSLEILLFVNTLIILMKQYKDHIHTHSYIQHLQFIPCTSVAFTNTRQTLINYKYSTHTTCVHNTVNNSLSTVHISIVQTWVLLNNIFYRCLLLGNNYTIRHLFLTSCNIILCDNTQSYHNHVAIYLCVQSIHTVNRFLLKQMAGYSP